MIGQCLANQTNRAGVELLQSAAMLSANAESRDAGLAQRCDQLSSLCVDFGSRFTMRVTGYVLRAPRCDQVGERTMFSTEEWPRKSLAQIKLHAHRPTNSGLRLLANASNARRKSSLCMQMACA